MNDPLLIVLCPLRSFSSVVAAMLGQHPEMYGVPELNLFLKENVGEMLDMHDRVRAAGIMGLLRTLAQLHEEEQTEKSVQRARAWLDARRHLTTKEVMDHLMELISPRILVDKSPRTVMKAETLQRVHRLYPAANYLHLTRHPRSMGNSLLNMAGQYSDWGGRFDIKRLDPERFWFGGHQNIVDFTERLPWGQVMRIKGEALLGAPDVYLPQIAEWLGLRTDREAIEAMKRPEQSPYASLGPKGAEYGNDPNFLANPSLREGKPTEPRLGGPLEWAKEREFDHATLKLAKQFGYG